MKNAGKIILKTAFGLTAATAVFGITYNEIVLTRKSKKVIEIADKINAKKAQQNTEEKPEQEPKKIREDVFCTDNSGEWYDKQEKEHTVITNFADKRIHAFIVRAKKPSSKWAIITHGYSSAPGGMSEQAMYYGEHGYNLLLPALRGHGVSEEKYISMGWYDRLDMLDWISYILSLDKDAEIVLHGVSMGAGTAMLTTGEALPENVKCCIADCGYTTLWEEYESEFKTHYHIPTFPLLYSANLATKLICGFSYKEVSCVEQLKKSKTPTLFIHGEKDTFVPYWMSEKNYCCCSAEKELLPIPDAQHAESCRVHPEIYWSRLQEFLNKYISEKQVVKV